MPDMHWMKSAGDRGFSVHGCDARLSLICRADRTGFPEVIWGANKTPLQIVTILRKLAESDDVAVATRVDPQVCALAANPDRSCHPHPAG